MNYGIVCCQANLFTTPSSLSHPALITPLTGDPVVEPAMGHSDEAVYGYVAGLAVYNMFYGAGSTHVTYTLPAPLNNLDTETFAKRGSTFVAAWFKNGVDDRHIVTFDAASGGQLTNTTPFAKYDKVYQLTMTDNFIYAGMFFDDGITAGPWSIKKLSYAGALVDTFLLDDIGNYLIAPASDNLIYVLASNPSAGWTALYYLKNFTDLILVGYTLASTGISAFAPRNAIFTNGAFYYGATGFSGFTTDIFKIDVACPTTPQIASLTRGASSVAAGATIDVSWAAVLQPDASDKIQLRPKPAAGHIGFVGAALASQNCDGLSGSSLSFTIPGGTTPGDYVFMYAALNKIYVMQTASFTVT
jgi:hypothetical protein